MGEGESGRLIALIEPRSNTMRMGEHRARLAESTRDADRVYWFQPEGMEWITEGAGRSRYDFKLVLANRIIPNPELVTVKIPDATPELVSA